MYKILKFNGIYVHGDLNRRFHYIKRNELISDNIDCSWDNGSEWSSFKEININWLLNPVYEIY